MSYTTSRRDARTQVLLVAFVVFGTAAPIPAHAYTAHPPHMTTAGSHW